MFRKLVLFAFLFDFVLKSNAEYISAESAIRRDERNVDFFDVFDTVGKFFHKVKKIFTIQEMGELKNVFIRTFNINRIQRQESDNLENSLRTGSTKYKLVGNLPTSTFKHRPFMNTEQLIAAHGYLSESHTVLTEDGYMLTMHRVVKEFDRINCRVVLLHHGLLGSSDDWLLLGRSEALPYKLVEYGFDVWLLNARGNRYSRVHTTMSTDSPAFWDFSWHEIGVYDLPAEIKYISEVTNSSDLNFIGHSMGCTALLVLLSTMPQYNTIISSAILLAPLVFMYQVKGPLAMLANFYRENGKQSLNFLGQTEFLRNEVFPAQIIQKYCKGLNRSCYNNLLLLGNGGGGYMWDEKVTADVLAHVPAGGSTKTVIHYVQLVNSGFFQMFDYGAKNNRIKYNTGVPPSYKLLDITLPIAMFSAPSDWLATKSYTQTLLSLLNNVKLHRVINSRNFGHFDFLWSPYAPQFVYNFLVQLLDQQLPRVEKEHDDRTNGW